ncbi:MAG: response regulator transcription factor [Chloroflexi bacterium]|nr:response regulator transcription factor [Chloroflexota bacterium]
MPSKKVSALVVDDDVRMLRMMQRILELEGYHVRTASNGEAALEIFDEDNPDLILLDIMMPGMDGYALCQNIREFSEAPIIMVTAKDKNDEKVEGFNKGADDYVTKPFSANELAARAKAVLRRAKLWEERPEPTFYSDNLTIDFARRRVTLGGQEVNLTATEYRILSYLAHNVDRIVTPNQILERVWNREYIGETHLLRVNIARLRQKLKEDPKSPRHILTRSGIGYMLQQNPVLP